MVDPRKSLQSLAKLPASLNLVLDNFTEILLRYAKFRDYSKTERGMHHLSQAGEI
jgi:hypothetical protein